MHHEFPASARPELEHLEAVGEAARPPPARQEMAAPPAHQTGARPWRARPAIETDSSRGSPRAVKETQGDRRQLAAERASNTKVRSSQTRRARLAPCLTGRELEQELGREAFHGGRCLTR